MSPIEIIIAVCLCLGPWFAGTAIGMVLGAGFDVYRERRHCWKRLQKNYNYEEVILKSWIIFWFWYSVGLSLGAYSCGCYIQDHIDLVDLLS